MAALTRDQFFAKLAPTVIRVRREGSTMFPSVRLAQNLLETGGVIHSWNNLGGIKVGSGQVNAYWQGQAVVKGTWEYVDGRNASTRAAFRAYKSVYHFYKDSDLLLANPRYDRVRRSMTPEQQADMLQASGYATDPAYASKLKSIMQRYGLKRYDAAGTKKVPNPSMLEEAESVAVLHDGLVMTDGYLLRGVTWVPARLLGEALGAEIDWVAATKQATVNGQALVTVLSESTGYVPIRDLAAVIGMTASWDASARAVLLD
ncbi:glucosaminidase domain-containing protein [Paenibacillus arenilitoris]|uniref:Glucosaminidase domain-containing protein n=1 Tax=Paenibacillus arenilitoris TaxID=2772299 RepID=A0A927CPN3_9BACL|nr:glucosaminidase domain-containing protein [Paenibacillus arenilitoris]MBD2871419.1 glucosaminidase domain-containing protein [Paenibacillus arenilitoris]